MYFQKATEINVYTTIRRMMAINLMPNKNTTTIFLPIKGASLLIFFGCCWCCCCYSPSDKTFLLTAFATTNHPIVKIVVAIFDSIRWELENVMIIYKIECLCRRKKGQFVMPKLNQTNITSNDDASTNCYIVYGVACVKEKKNGNTNNNCWCQLQ